jgi:hypothetical protein
MALENWHNNWKSVRSVCYSPRKWSETYVFTHPGCRLKIGHTIENQSGTCAVAHESDPKMDVFAHPG